MGSPRLRGILPGSRSVGRPVDEKGYLPDAHKPEYSCRRRSPDSVLVGQIAQPVPFQLGDVILQAPAAERGPAKLKFGIVLSLGKLVPQASLDHRLDRGSLTIGQGARRGQDGVRNFNRGLHVGTHILSYACPYLMCPGCSEQAPVTRFRSGLSCEAPMRSLSPLPVLPRRRSPRDPHPAPCRRRQIFSDAWSGTG